MMASSFPAERGEQIWRLFNEVVDLAPEACVARLNQACRDDPDLRREVESLLDAHAHADGVLDAYELVLLGPQKAERARPTGLMDDPLRLVGQTVSHYRILAHLGGGGMGVVYKADDTRLKRPVALKFLSPDLTRDAEATARFLREAQAAAALEHASICTVHEIGQTESGQLFIVMTCYEGETLKKKIGRGALPVEEALDYAAQIAEGLERAHEAGIVHRDVKPANVMVTNRGRVKIVDFGLAKAASQTQLTRSGATLGTVAYMSPEQARGEAVDHRADLWSLGVVLYEMLTGERPFRGDYPEAVLYAIRHDAPQALRVVLPEALARVIEKALAKNPDERYQHAEEMLADLNALRQGSEPALPEASSLPSRRRRFFLYYGAAVLVVVLLLFLIGRALLTDSGVPIRSMGVLPMTNLSGDPDQEYVADGITDLLISTLSRLSGLDRVISRTSMMQYKDTDKTLVEIGRELGVDALIEASVRSDGEQIMVTVNLIEAATERHLWGRTYERAFRDVLKLQREIALAIAGEVEVALTPQDEAHMAEAPEVDPRAMDRYLLGQNAWHKSDASGVSHAEFMQARDYFEQAIEIDSSFARPHAGLPVIYHLLEGEAGKAKARRYAKKALDLDPMLSEAHVAVGICQNYDWDWAGAEVSFRQAIELNPGNSEAHRELGILMGRTARFEDGVAALRRAVELAPLSSVTRGSLTYYGYYFDRQFDQLIEQARLDSDYYWLGTAYMHKGKLAQAREAFMSCCKDDTLRFAYFYAMSGERDKALSLLREIEGAVEERVETEGRVRSLHERWGLAITVGETYAALGETDRAFIWLNRAREVIPWGLGMVLPDPALDPLRSEPRFQALAAEMGLDPWGRVK